MGGRKRKKKKKQLRRTIRSLSDFAVEALADFAGNVLYGGVKRLTRLAQSDNGAGRKRDREKSVWSDR